MEFACCSRYLVRQGDLHSVDEIMPTLQTSKAKLVIEIPSDFGRNMLRQQ